METAQEERLSGPALQCDCCGASLSDGTRYRYINNLNWDGTGAITSDVFDIDYLVTCGRCGFGRIEGDIEPAALAKYYEESYYRHRPKDKPTFHAPRALAQILGALPSLPYNQFRDNRIQILDIGAGKGATLMASQLLFQQPSLFAFEPSVTRNEGLDVEFIGDFLDESYTIPAHVVGRFHLVILSHVIEHYSPRSLKGVIERIQRMMAPGGVLVIETPHADMSDPAFQHHRQMTTDATHTLFFTESALQELLTRHGFGVARMYRVSATHAQVADVVRQTLRPELGGIKRSLRKLLWRFPPVHHAYRRVRILMQEKPDPLADFLKSGEAVPNPEGRNIRCFAVKETNTAVG